MYETFYKLRLDPFRLSPDPRFSYLHPSYRRAHAYMQYALGRAEGLVMITGQPGTGKTTLIGDLLSRLDAHRHTVARLATTQLRGEDFLRAVAYALGLPAEGLDQATVLRDIERFLGDQQESGRTVLLVVDEAQDLSDSALTELRLLANMQRGSALMLQAFLVGHDGLRKLVKRPEMQQLQQRIIAACHLDPLSAADTARYVRHRLERAGWENDPQLVDRVFPLIHRFSGGIPRQINLIAGRLLLHGSVEEKHRLDADDAREVIAGLREEHLSPADELYDLDLEAAPDIDDEPTLDDQPPEPDPRPEAGPEPKAAQKLEPVPAAEPAAPPPQTDPDTGRAPAAAPAEAASSPAKPTPREEAVVVDIARSTTDSGPAPEAAEVAPPAREPQPGAEPATRDQTAGAARAADATRAAKARSGPKPPAAAPEASLRRALGDSRLPRRVSPYLARRPRALRQRLLVAAVVLAVGAASWLAVLEYRSGTLRDWIANVTGTATAPAAPAGSAEADPPAPSQAPVAARSAPPTSAEPPEAAARAPSAPSQTDSIAAPAAATTAAGTTDDTASETPPADTALAEPAAAEPALGTLDTPGEALEQGAPPAATDSPQPRSPLHLPQQLVQPDDGAPAAEPPPPPAVASSDREPAAVEGPAAPQPRVARLDPLPAVDTKTSIVTAGPGLRLLLDNGVEFAAGRAELDPAYHSQLRRLAEIVQPLSNVRLEVVGHTSSSPANTSPDAIRLNMELSLRRAENVARFLSELGVPAERIRIRGQGARDPLEDNGTEQGRRRNRRVEIFVRPGDGQPPDDTAGPLDIDTGATATPTS